MTLIPPIAVDPNRFYQKILLFIFFACPKKMNQKKGRLSLAHLRWVPSAPRNYREFENPLRSNSRSLRRFVAPLTSNSFFGSFCGARLRANGDKQQAHNFVVTTFLRLHDTSALRMVPL